MLCRTSTNELEVDVFRLAARAFFFALEDDFDRLSWSARSTMTRRRPIDSLVDVLMGNSTFEDAMHMARDLIDRDRGFKLLWR